MTFTIIICGFQPRTPLEITDAGHTRMEKIFRLIASCKYGIHDISRTDANANRLPRYNIPLELGLFLGAQKFEPLRVRQKQTLIMDKAQFHYQRVISDLAGMDIFSHDSVARNVVDIVRNWLRAHSPEPIPSTESIWKEYRVFRRYLPKILKQANLDYDELSYPDFAYVLTTWIRERRP